MNISRRSFVALCGTSATLVALRPAWAQQTPLKVAIVMPGNITDKSWNQAGYESIQAVKEKLGVDIAYSEKVVQADQAEAMADYARRGFQLVIGHGGEFQDAAKRVAPRYPKSIFMVNNGQQGGGNLASADFNYKQPGYLMGYIAGKMSKTGKAGWIGGQKIKFSLDLNSSYEEGFKAAGGKEVFTAYTNDWDDIAKGKEAALNQIAQGADVIFPTMDNAVIGSLQACKEKGVYGFGLYYDAISDWPETILQSAIFDIKGAMLDYVGYAKEGKLEGKNYNFNLSQPEACRIGSFNPAIPEAVKTEVAGLVDKMKSGALKP
ncbi:BMP family ABC transporter substrate-binding protein [Starkeya sp. ORNL1]|uniref:BMP family protein n=1 Tax=Starkeya sp. ORNL1 TaxID=2709380 RepID=UPI001462F427|nr:BMP family protein [Starkeya sp. ORNL1]QJP12338.1 BMP family ABC transporter substrate-binding protein [Starkeya sp. ORNL1]